MLFLYENRILLSFLLITLYLFLTRLRTWHRLSSFHGPFLASISYLPMLRIRRSPRPHLTYASLSQRHGPLTRIGPNDLLAADPDLLRRMSAARSPYGRSSWYRATRLDPYHDMMGSVTDKRAHAALRAKTAAGYAGRDNPALEADLDAQIGSLVALLRREYLTRPSGSSSSSSSSSSPSSPSLPSSLEQPVEEERHEEARQVPVDFGRLADFYAHDARAQLAFGRPLGMLEQNRDVYGIVHIAKLALEWIQVFTDIPPLQRLFLSRPVLRALGPKPTDDFGVGKLMGMARELVASRFAPGAKEQQDLLGSFLRHGLDRRSAESEVMFPIIAGSDTTANALKGTVSHLAADPRASGLLREEIRAALAAGGVSSPATYEEAQRLPYLQATIWESLRAHPPFGGLIMKQTGPEGDFFEGRFIPPGTRIAHSTWAVTHDARVYGPDVDVFRPERWLEAGEDVRGAMHRQTELVFGSGRFGCPGRAIALMELSKILVELFRNFDFQLHNQDASALQKRHEISHDSSMPLVIREL